MSSSSDSAAGAAALRGAAAGVDSVDANSWVDAALRSQHIAVAVISLFENRYIRANLAMAAICGVSLDELFNIDPFTLALRVTHPDELEEEQQKFGEMATGKRAFYEMEKRYRQPDGSVRWGRLTFSAVYDQAPNSGAPAVSVKYVVLQIVDITRERQLAEALQKREAEVLHAQKIEGLGRLAAGIAHDFNNLLTVITGHGEVLRTALSEPEFKELLPRVSEDVEAILAAADRAAALTAQLLTHGRRERAVPRRFFLSDLVGTLQRLFVRTLGSNIQIEQSLDAQGAILADQGQIGQVVMNLMLNARDAISNGGHIWLTTKDLVVEASEATERLEAGDWVVLSVADDGHGMSVEVQARMFEPFFTTREERPGTQGSGLGLATVQRIVAEAGARVEVKSSPVGGTTVDVYFPRVPYTAPSLEPELPPVRNPKPNTRRVLVVEDDPAVRTLIATILVQSHYLVMVARNGEEGLRLLSAEAEPADLIVTDLIMPRITGLALARTLEGRGNPPKMLFISGYSSHTPAEVALFGELLPKPFTPAQLVAAVVHALGDDVGDATCA